MRLVQYAVVIDSIASGLTSNAQRFPDTIVQGARGPTQQIPGAGERKDEGQRRQPGKQNTGLPCER